MSVRPTALEGDAGAWDAFVTQAEGSGFCHLAGWHEVMHDVLGAECHYLVVSGEDGELEGVLPLARVKSRLFGHYLVSLPFLNHGGPIGTPRAVRLLVRSAVREAVRSRADLLELRTRRDLDLGLPLSMRKHEVVLDLPAAEETLWDGYSAKLRSQIRRPMKEGLEAKFGAEHVDAFYDVFARTMRDLGTPVLPRAWFERIARTFPAQVVFGVVYRGSEPLAAGCGFVWRGEFEITWACSVRRASRIAPNMLLYWAFMQEMIRRGVTRFNFGRTTPGSGPHKFKQQWGGRDVPLPWCRYTSGERAAPPSPGDSAYSWGPRLWRHLPLPVANAVGPHLVRYLP